MKAGNLEKIVQDGKLEDFALGKNDFFTLNPGVDYSRWIELQKYYESLEQEHPHKEGIRKTIVDLFFDGDEDDTLYTSISIGRILRLQEIIDKLVNIIAKNELHMYSKRIQNLILFSATKLQLSEIGEQVATQFMEDGRLDEFLLTSATPSYANDVREEDHWQLDIVGQIFEKSDVDTREEITNKFKEVLTHSLNLRLAVQKYLLTSNVPKTYRLFLENI